MENDGLTGKYITKNWQTASRTVVYCGFIFCDLKHKQREDGMKSRERITDLSFVNTELDRKTYFLQSFICDIAKKL